MIILPQDSRYSTLTEVLRETTVYGSGMPPKILASKLGVDLNYLYRMVNADDHGAKLGADLVLPILAATEKDDALHWLALMRGGVFISLRDIAGAIGRSSGNCNPLSALRKALLAANEFGEFAATIQNSIDNDGLISADEAASIRKEGHDAVTAILAAVEACLRATGEPTPGI